MLFIKNGAKNTPILHPIKIKFVAIRELWPFTNLGTSANMYGIHIDCPKVKSKIENKNPKRFFSKFTIKKFAIIKNPKPKNIVFSLNFKLIGVNKNAEIIPTIGTKFK